MVQQRIAIVVTLRLPEFWLAVRRDRDYEWLLQPKHHAAGAIDFLVKPCRQEVLLAAIRQSLERSGVLLVREMQLRDLRHRYASLTPCERQVMALAVSGLLNKQVGGELGISELTVKAHQGQSCKR